MAEARMIRHDAVAAGPRGAAHVTAPVKMTAPGFRRSLLLVANIAVC